MFAQSKDTRQKEVNKNRLVLRKNNHNIRGAVTKDKKETGTKESEESKIIEFVKPTKPLNESAGIPEGYEFFCDQYGTASTTINGIVVAIESEEFHNRVASDYFVQFHKIFGAQNWEKAKRYFKIVALNAPIKFSPLRCHVAENGTIYYDTGDFIHAFDGNDMKVYTPEACPIKFRRYKHSLSAPIRRPVEVWEKGKKPVLSDYKSVISRILDYFGSQGFNPSLLPCFFVDRHAHPIICFTGAAGSAKSTFQTVIKRLVDPTSGERLNMGDDKNDWVTMWDKFYVLDFDNVRSISAEEADMLSRAVTGGSIIRRTLYTTSDVSIFSGKLRIMMNGIRPEPSQFNDLLDRMILVELSRISPEKRLSDEKLWEAITEALPEVRYACLDLAARAYKRMWTYNHKKLPRLGEFARLADAINVELHEGEPEGEPGLFINWYFDKIKEASSAGVEDNFANVMLRFLNEPGNDWFRTSGATTHQWLSAIIDYCTARDDDYGRYHRPDLKRSVEQKDFPHTAVHLGRRITEIVPVLADHGFRVVKFRGVNGTEYKIIKEEDK